jgi:broad specificity phosphatase PhoE
MIESVETGPALACDRLPGSVLIVRHAQSAANVGGRTVDPATIPITELGRSQAQCVRNLVPDPPDVIIVSCYIRTVQTAEPVTSRFPNVSVQEWPVHEFTYLDPALCAGTTYSERKPRVDAYWNALDPQLRNGARCESFSDFVQRVAEMRMRLMRVHATRPVIVFTHGYVMKALLWLQQVSLITIRSEEMALFDVFRRRTPTPNCSVLRGVATPEGLLLRPTASVDHIPAHLRTD